MLRFHKLSQSSFVTILQNKIPADISTYMYNMVPTKLHHVIRDKSDVETSKIRLVYTQHVCKMPHSALELARLDLPYSVSPSQHF